MKKAPSYETQDLREFAEVLRGRRTVDLYLQTAVPAELVDEAIEAAIWAPNHHVTEPWHFYALGDATKSACLDLCHAIVSERKGAEMADFKRKSWSEKPGWVVVTCQRSADALREQEDYASCAVAIQNFMLYLWKAGVGSKWTTGPITRDPRFFEILRLDPADVSVVGLVWFGYPKLTPAQTRKPLEDVFTRLP